MAKGESDCYALACVCKWEMLCRPASLQKAKSESQTFFSICVNAVQNEMEFINDVFKYKEVLL